MNACVCVCLCNIWSLFITYHSYDDDEGVAVVVRFSSLFNNFYIKFFFIFSHFHQLLHQQRQRKRQLYIFFCCSTYNFRIRDDWSHCPLSSSLSLSSLSDDVIFFFFFEKNEILALCPYTCVCVSVHFLFHVILVIRHRKFHSSQIQCSCISLFVCFYDW